MTKKTNIFIKLAIIALCAFFVTQIFDTAVKLVTIENERTGIRAQIAELESAVAAMEHKLANADDDAVIEEIARAELGLVRYNEIFINSAG